MIPPFLKNFRHFAQVSWIVSITITAVYGWDSSDSFKDNTQKAVIAMMFLLFASGFMRNNRPIFQQNDLLWKASSRFGLFYCLFLVFIYFMNHRDAMEVVAIIEPKAEEQKLLDAYLSWDLNCELSYDNLSGKFDRYFWAHALGWILHSFYIKDIAMMWAWSLITELLELTFNPWMLVFSECWWDHIFADVLISNLSGMLIGIGLMKLNNVTMYDWFGRKGKKSIKDWDIWYSHYRFSAVMLFLIFQTGQF